MRRMLITSILLCFVGPNIRAGESNTLASAIKADIADAESLQRDAINVEVEDGHVTLFGSVDSLMDKRRASRIAKRLRGVRAVVNQLIVKQSDREEDAIREDVISRLKANDSINRLKIAVDVSGSEVAMTGKVESLAEKRIAETAAAGVIGVTHVENQITVGLSRNRTDEELRDEIKALIVQSVYFDDVNIEVDVKNRVAKLSGEVHSAAQREALGRAAEIWGITGVDLDEITINANLAGENIREARYANVTDEAIAEAVHRSLRSDPVVFTSADRIKVAVHSGTVTLSGTARTLRSKSKSERLAMNVVGVHHVVNEIKVKYDGETPSDAEIINLTQKALRLSPYLDRRDVRVHCDRAHVSLYGVAESKLEKNIAGWIAGGVPGVVHVNNSLAVERARMQKSDQQIKSDLERKLKFAFYDDADLIDVEVSGGVAILSGTVDTWRQWQEVIDLALEAGARNPHNMVDVRFHPPHGASRVYVPE